MADGDVCARCCNGSVAIQVMMPPQYVLVNIVGNCWQGHINSTGNFQDSGHNLPEQNSISESLDYRNLTLNAYVTFAVK